MKAFIRITTAAALAATAACTVSNTEIPDLAGPSEFALSLTVSATPDTIRHDGVDSSVIVVTARNAQAQPVSGLAVRLDVFTNGGAPADFGTLSSRSIVTGSDGTARATYTAPPTPPISAPVETCEGLTGACVRIGATPVGTNFSVRPSELVRIHLIRPSVITPPTDPTAPTAAFSIAAAPPSQPRRFFFDASASTAIPGRSIVRYEWNWGDGESAAKSIPTEDHDYPNPGVYQVTLTVVDSAGVRGSTTVILSAF
jgi:PKD domain/Invasin, domain 3